MLRGELLDVHYVNCTVKKKLEKKSRTLLLTTIESIESGSTERSKAN